MREVGGGVNVLPLPLDESPPCRPRPHPETGERICRRCRWGDTPRDARRMTGGCTAPTAIFREPAVLRRLPRWWISRSRPDRCGEGGGAVETVFQYGTTLHVGYRVPIVAPGASGLRPASPERNNDDDGLVPVVVQRPILYSASAILNDRARNNDDNGLVPVVVQRPVNEDDNININRHRRHPILLQI